MSFLATFRERLVAFLFPPLSDTWLSILRIGLGCQILFYCLALGKDWNQLFSSGKSGLISRGLMEDILALDSPLIPKLGWLVTLGAQLGLSEQTALGISWTLLLCAACLLILGLFCRFSAIVTWFFFLCSVKSANWLTYGVDNVTTIGLFYLMLAPFPDHYALDRKIWRSPIKDRHLHGFFRRVLQLHLSVIYFSGGVAKSLGAGWWNGESIWRALTRPPFNILPAHIVISGRALLPIVGIAIVLLETGYPIFIWLKKTRLIWLIAIIGMHIGIAFTMGLYLFALIMIVLNLAAFAPEFLFRERRSEDSLSAGATNSTPVGS